MCFLTLCVCVFCGTRDVTGEFPQLCLPHVAFSLLVPRTLVLLKCLSSVLLSVMNDFYYSSILFSAFSHYSQDREILGDKENILYFFSAISSLSAGVQLVDVRNVGQRMTLQKPSFLSFLSCPFPSWSSPLHSFLLFPLFPLPSSCISFFSVAVINTLMKATSGRKGLFWLMVTKERSPSWWGGVATVREIMAAGS